MALVEGHMGRIKALVDGAMGSRVVTAASRGATRGGLRVLAYHGVNDIASFAAQIDHITDHYVPVSAAEVVAAVSGGPRLPPRGVWVTFDDGDPSVVENALPVLHQAGIEATMFVCPAVIDTDVPLWWQTAEQVLDTGISVEFGGTTYDQTTVDDLVGRLKRVPDAERRALIARLDGEGAASSGTPLRTRQLTKDGLLAFVDGGGSVGNHTWDHPCLDMVAVEDQREQIISAHAWLADVLGRSPRLFAYPNGNHADASEAVLEELDYAVATLFDHRIASVGTPSALRMSRLRVNDTTTLSRFASILAGVHPAAYAIRTRVRGG